MENPFDDEHSQYFVLKNNGQFYSIWPAFLDVPAGWSIVAGPALRAEILAFVECESNQIELPVESGFVDAKA